MHSSPSTCHSWSGYGLFLAGANAAVAERAHQSGRPRLERAATAAAWLGPLAGPTTTTLAVAAGALALIGALVTRNPT